MKCNLYDAAKEGNITAVRGLIERGAEIDATCGSLGETPMMMAAMAGFTKIVRLLLESGAEVNAQTSEGIQAKRGDRYTALMYAAQAGHVQTVQLLLRYGADPRLTIRKGINSADMAAKFGFCAVIAILKEVGVVPNEASVNALNHVSTISPAIAERIRAIDWFAHCGTPLSLSLGVGVQMVPSWDEAKQHCATRKWQNTPLEAQNTLTSYLFHNHLAAYNDHWNSIAIAANCLVQTVSYPKLFSIQEKMNLDDTFVASIRRGIVGAIIEDAFTEFMLPTDFFRELLRIYEAGHFPCGWVEGDWPIGRLLVL